MKFSCDNCEAQYQIGDDKIGPRGVKVRCKRCGHMIVVRPAAAPEEAEAEADTAPRAGGSVAAVEADEERFVRTQVMEAPEGWSNGEPALEPPGDTEPANVQLPPFETEAPTMAELDLAPPVAAEHVPEDTTVTDEATRALDADRAARAAKAADLELQQEEAGSGVRLSALAELAAADAGEDPVTAVSPALGDEPWASAEVAQAADDEALFEFEAPEPAQGTEPAPSSEADVRLPDMDELLASASETLDVPPPTASASEPQVPQTAAPGPLMSALQSDPDEGAVDPDAFTDAPVEDEIGSAFEAMFDPSNPGPEPDADPEPPPIRTGPQAAEWYVAVEDEQVGPLTVDEVQARWSSGDVGPSSLCWKKGMADWTSIENVEDLQAVTTSGPPARAPSGVAFGATAQPLTGEVAPAIALASEAPDAAAEISAAAEQGWRPSAASALASLAAEELSSEPNPSNSAAASKPTTGKMTALPTANSELSNLLSGTSSESEATASRFGLAEKSVSKVRAIPRRAETLGATPLSEPATESALPWKRYAAIGGGVVGLLLVGALGANALNRTGAPPDPSLAAAPVVPSPAPTPPAAGAPAPSSPTEAPRAATAVPTPTPQPAVSAPAKGTASLPAASVAAARTGVPTEPAATPKSLSNQALVAAAAPAPREASPPPAVKPTPAKKTVAKVKKRRRRPKRVRSRAVAERRTRTQPKPAVRSTPKPAARKTPPKNEDLLRVAPPKSKRTPPPPKAAPVPAKLDETEVFRVLRRNKAQVRDCIEKHARSGGERGKVRVTITITPVGRVSRTSFTPSSFGRQVLGKCLSSNARTWRFPKFSGPATPVGFPVTVK